MNKDSEREWEYENGTPMSGDVRAYLKEHTRLLQCERRLAAIILWLEENQDDVFRRGIWDVIELKEDL